jgi:hypothetical protein
MKLILRTLVPGEKWVETYRVYVAPEKSSNTVTAPTNEFGPKLGNKTKNYYLLNFLVICDLNPVQSR